MFARHGHKPANDNVSGCGFGRKRAVVLVLAGALGALGFAFYSQFVKNLYPCELCMWQRWVYAAVIALCVVSLAARRPSMAKFGGLLVTVALGAEVAVAVYHAGIEYKLWQGFQACSSTISGGLTIEELREKIIAAPVTRCDQPAWFFMGLTLAAWNVVYSFALLVVSLLPVLKCRKST